MFQMPQQITNYACHRRSKPWHNPTTIIIPGSAYLKNLPQLMGYPSLSAMAVPTTLADAPIGVALPPISVPNASVHDSVGKLRFAVWDRL